MSYIFENKVLEIIYQNIINEWGVIFLLAFIIIPYLLEKYITNKTENTKEIILILRSTMLWMFLFFVVKDIIFSKDISHEDDNYIIIVKLIKLSFILLMSTITFNVIKHIIDIKVISKKKNGTKRGLKLLTLLMTIIITFILVVDISGLSEVFEAGTILGVTGLLLGLTSNIWFPDLFSGLVIIFTNMFQEEQIIEIEELGIYGIVDKIGIFNTTIRNYVNHHKVIKPNNEIRKSTINNLSKMSSAKGLREKLIFKIGYIGTDGKEMTYEKVESMCEEAFIKTETHKTGITILFDRKFELYITDLGDHAIEYHLFYYSKDIKQRLQNRYNLYRVFYSESIRHKIGLNTPITHEILNAKINTEISIKEDIKRKHLSKNFLKLTN